MTDFSDKVNILGRFKVLYQDSDSVKDFFDFNDIGLPLAYLASEGLCDISDDGKKYIAETWDIFLSMLGVEDTGFEDLDEVLAKAENKP